MSQSYGFCSSSNQHYKNVSPLRDSKLIGFANRSRLASHLQTDKRIEEIKRKYDTPNRRDRLSHISSSKKSQYLPIKVDDIRNKENITVGTGVGATALSGTLSGPVKAGDSTSSHSHQHLSHNRGQHHNPMREFQTKSFMNNPSTGTQVITANRAAIDRDYLRRDSTTPIKNHLSISRRQRDDRERLKFTSKGSKDVRDGRERDRQYDLHRDRERHHERQTIDHPLYRQRQSLYEKNTNNNTISYHNNLNNLTRNYDTSSTSIKNGQEDFFRKVKQMKQSLLYSDAGQPSSSSNAFKDSSVARTGEFRYNNNLNMEKEVKEDNTIRGTVAYRDTSEKMRTGGKASGYYESSSRPEQMSRINNIDKINQKIKGILDCLNENERTRTISYQQKRDTFPHNRYDSQEKSDIQLKLKNSRPRSRYNPRNADSTVEQPSVRKSANLQNAIVNSNTSNGQPSKSSHLLSGSLVGNQENFSSKRHRQINSRNVESGEKSPSYARHKHGDSDLLEKIEISRPVLGQDKQSTSNKNRDNDEKWEKLSSKLERYEAENKLRIQNALDGKLKRESGSPRSEVFDSELCGGEASINKRGERPNNTRSFYQPSSSLTLQKQKQHIDHKQNTRSIDLARQICAHSFVGSSGVKSRELSVQPRKFHNYELKRSGKKLDDEIDKLQLKIRQNEEEKKKLNISFKPFTYSNSKSVVALPVNGGTGLKPQQDLSDRKPSQFGARVAKSAIKNRTSVRGGHDDALQRQHPKRFQVESFRHQNHVSFNVPATKKSKDNQQQRNITGKLELEDGDYSFEKGQNQEAVEAEHSGIIKRSKLSLAVDADDEVSLKAAADNESNPNNNRIVVERSSFCSQSAKTSKFISSSSRRRETSLKTSHVMLQDSVGASRQQQYETEKQSYAVELTTKEQIQHNQQGKKTSSSKACREEAYFYDDEELRRKTDKGIRDRKKLLQSGSEAEREKPIKTDLKRFVQDLTKQVTLDQELRNGKIWLSECGDLLDVKDNNGDSSKSNINKYESLQQILQKNHSLSIEIGVLKQKFIIRECQNNPFFSVQQNSSSLERLAQVYVQAEKHWKDILLHKFSRESLIRQGFTSKEVDLQKKGYINLEDLVRFLNMESGNFYRNRDLALLFIRLCDCEGGQGNGENRALKTTFDSVLNAFCC